jgi:rare lipoprotein A
MKVITLMIAIGVLFTASCAGKRSFETPETQPKEGSKCTPQKGLASWYGRREQGKPTASGERFDTNKLTAASRVLPLGTRVRVTNKSNGRSVVVRINDRGPYERHGPRRVIDLSHAAASAIGIVQAGLGPVEVDCI